MADPIRAALERAARELELVATSLTQAGWTAAGGRARNESHAARTALAAQPPAPPPDSDGEREELAAWLENQAADLRNVHTISAGLSWAAASRRAALLEIAATLVRTPAPAAVPVAVSESPWEREGWLHPEDGWCWWSPDFTTWHRRGPSTVYGGSMLPHWAIPVPQPPHGGEVQP
jgi:hypothetical protein